MRRTSEGRHLPKGGTEPERRIRPRGALLGTAFVVLVATGGLVSANTGSVRHLLSIVSPAQVTTPTITPTSTTTLPLPTVVSVSPRQGTSGVPWNSSVTIVLSRPPAPGAPMPTITPSVPGQWMANSDTLTFAPAASYQAWTTEKVSIPAGLATPEESSFSTEGVPLLRFEQLLAELEYLPLNFVPSSGSSGLDSQPTSSALVSPVPEPGTFSWRYSNIPSSLSSLWTPETNNAVTAGAVMQFESDHGLIDDGVVGPTVWSSLIQAVANRAIDLSPYDYLMVSESIPEELSVWRDGQYIYSTAVNTGVAGAETAIGTFPVYARFQTTTMTGTDPDGYHYSVTGVPWVAYFNGGDAVHGYERASYGWPQSNGCVELPISNAQVVWSMDPIGTLVTVAG
jgi:L,D-transpeptidase catalytic domain/Bacterial Ig-like domain